MLAHSASLATQPQLEKKPNSNIVAKLATQCHSAPIAVLQILHLLSLRVPFVWTRLLCGVRLATLLTSLRNGFAHLVRKHHCLAPIAMPRTIRALGVPVRISLALGKYTFVRLVLLVMDLRKPQPTL